MPADGGPGQRHRYWLLGGLPRAGQRLRLSAAKPDGAADWGFMGIWCTEGTLNLGLRAARERFGVSPGTELATSGLLQVAPVHPRVALDLRSYDLPGGTKRSETDARFNVDVGADAVLGQSFVVRVGATLGNVNTFGVGIAYRLGCRLVVR